MLLSFVFLSCYYTTNFIFTKKTAICTTDCSQLQIITQSFPYVSGMAIFLMMSFDILFLKKHQGDAAVAFIRLRSS
jgi:hypothetical protein